MREGVEVPAGEGLPEPLEVRLEEALFVKAAEVAMGVEEAQREVLAEIDAEGQGARVGETVPLPDAQALETAEGVGVSKGEKDLLPGSGAVTPGLRVSAVVTLMLRDVHAVVVMLWVAVGEVEEEAQELELGDFCGEED